MRVHSFPATISSFTAFTLLCTALAIAQRSRPAPKPPTPGKWEPSAQQVFSPYWSLEPGWDTELEIHNNVSQRSLTATPVLRLNNGSEIPLPPVTVAADEVVSLNLRQLASSAAPQVLNHPDSFGSVEVQFPGMGSANVMLSTVVHSFGHPISFHFDGDDGSMAGTGSYIRGVWWLHGSSATDYLILSNFSSKPLVVSAVFSDTAGSTYRQQVTLLAAQSARLNVREIAAAAGLKGEFGAVDLRIIQGQSLGIAQIAFDETTGFSSLIKMFNDDASESEGDRVLHAPMLALSNPDAVLQLPEGTKLAPTLVLRNTTSAPLHVSGEIGWRSASTKGVAELGPMDLEPGKVSVIDLTALQAAGKIPQEANWATVALHFRGRSADLVALAASFDSTGRYGLQTPFSEGLAAHWKGSMWAFDPTHNSFITATNGGTAPTTAQLILYYDAGKNSYIMQRKLAPGEQIWADVGQLIGQQVPDVNGRTIPTTVTSGTYEIVDVDHRALGELYEGKLILDKTYGRAFYGCAECCGTRHTRQIPTWTAGIGDSIYDEVDYQDSCDFNWYDVTWYAYSWGSDNTSVVTIGSYGDVNAAGVGSAYTSSQIDMNGMRSFCPAQTFSQSAQNTVTPTISGGNTVWWFNGQSPTGYDIQTTLTTDGSATWAVTQGAGKVSLSATTGTQITVQSSGTDFSSAVGDVRIVATVNGQQSPEFYLTTRKPYLLAAPQSTPSCDSQYGFNTAISYEIRDQLQTKLPSDISSNELFTSGARQDNPNGNWASYGLPTSNLDYGTGYLIDNISGPGVNNVPAPIPSPVCVGDSTRQMSWDLEFRVGSSSAGFGVRVQTDTNVRFTNHGEHQAIVSPAP